MGLGQCVALIASRSVNPFKSYGRRIRKMGKKTAKSALDHSLHARPIFFLFFPERVSKTRIFETIKKIGHRLNQGAVALSKSVPFPGEKFKNRCKKTGCSWGKKPVTARRGSRLLEFWSLPKSKM
jgi:hypothetical protein